MPGTLGRATGRQSPDGPAAGEGADILAAPAADITWDVLSRKINDLVVLSDASGAIFYASPACRTLGYEQHELVGRMGADFLHPDDVAHFQGNAAALFSGAPVDPATEREHRFRLKDGTWIWLEGSPSLIHGPDGSPIGLLNVFRNVTEKRAILEDLQESERCYRLLADNSSDMISRTGSDRRMIYLSPSVERITGYSIAELLPREMREFVHPDDLAGFVAAYGALISGGTEGGTPIRYRVRRKDGSWIWLESNPRLVRSAAPGQPDDIIDVTRDVTEQQTLKIRLGAALAEAEKLAAVKSEFLANMSHEIRTPLTAVLGFTSLLAERRDLDPEAQHQVDRIAAAGRSLLAIVNDVLDFSKLEAGLATIAPRPTAVAALGGDALAMFELQAAGKGLALGFEVGAEVPPMVSVDPDRLRQILANLVGNAVKFTDRGRVSLKIGYDSTLGRLILEVADTGPGIAAEAREVLFQRFSQVDGSSTRAKGGTGLGLAICQGLVEAMGGAVAVRSRMGRGSTFSVSLPAPPAAPALHYAAELAGLRVLVVDDHAPSREVARAVLEAAGVEVSEAEDGPGGVTAAAGLPVDAILMDIGLPGLSGGEAATAIRAGDGPNRDIPILAFSADAEEAAAAPGAPFAGWVDKPMSPAALLHALHAAMTDEATVPEPEALRDAAA